MPTSRALAFAAALLACAALPPPTVRADDSLPLAVVALEPAPNYEPTSDEGDSAQLADGVYQRFPFWTRREAVGWIYETPVGITIDAATVSGSAYTLVLRSARQSSAGVAPPLRVDVYCAIRSSSAWYHAGSLVNNGRNTTDGAIVDLAVQFGGCGTRRLKVLVHANGGYIMLDEVVLTRARGPGGLPAPVAERIVDTKADSIRRLEPGLMQAALQASADAVREFDPGRSYAGLAMPWGHLDRPTTALSLAVHTLPSMGARYVIGIANADSRAHEYLVETAPGGHDVVPPVVQMLQAVLSADGRLVFDALDAPLSLAQPIRLAPATLAFALVTEARGASTGLRRWQVRDDAGWQQTLTVDVTLYDAIRPEVADTPRVLVWAYPRDRPIWSRRGAAAIIDRLSEAGVNVFDIHPADVPQPFATAEWRVRSAALRSELARYRGRGLVLLLLSQESWQKLAAMNDGGSTRAQLKSWVTLIVTTMREAGFAANDWALYPLDEPHGSDVNRLADVIDKLREIEPKLRFYANPIAESGLDISTPWRLRALKARVDYWQPKVGAAYVTTRAMLGTDAQKGLWLYAVPPPPARSALPACYRELGRLAFDQGAWGLGFWSFSDTSESSAWSDFDGRRPDWSVVYESKDGSAFVSGRRWEGFTEGVADYAGLRFCERRAGADLGLASQCRAWRAALEAGRPDCPGWW